MFHKLLVALALAGLAGLAGLAAAETVYKWVDTSGQIHYTDLPPRQEGARLLGIIHDYVEDFEDEDFDEEAGDQGDEGTGATSAAGTPSDLPPVTRDEVAAVNAEVASARNKRCKDAQDRYQRYLESRRLFRETPDGKRVYLTDQELTEARVRAKQAVDEYCS